MPTPPTVVTVGGLGPRATVRCVAARANEADDDAPTSGADVVLLTRFNLPSEGAESLIRAEEGWLTDRWGLFERYTVPSIRAQTDPDVHWLVYLDPESPTWLKDGIAQLDEEGLLRPIYRERVDHAELIDDIEETLGAAHRPMLATANLDNDDGLAPDFVARLRAASDDGERRAVYFEIGLIRSPTRLYLRHDPVNAFGAVAEPWPEPVTCWLEWHNLLGNHMPVRVLTGEPAWLQVVHGRNVSNRALGELIDPTRYRAAFPGTLDDLEVPSASTLAAERYVVRPLRGARRSAPRRREVGVHATVRQGRLDPREAPLGLGHVPGALRGLTLRRSGSPAGRPSQPTRGR